MHLLREAQAGDDDENLMVHRGTHAYVLLNLYPYSNGHLMVAPYRHLAMPGELTAEERAEVWELLDQGITALTAVMSPEGFNSGSTSAGSRGPAWWVTCICTWYHAGMATPTSCRCSPTCG